MISRQWRGLAKRMYADEYVKHLRDETFPVLRSIQGFVDASILRRELEQGVEFLVVTRWGSLRAIEQFAGPDPQRAVVPQKVHEMMVDYDRSVRHFEVIEKPARLLEAASW